MDESKQYIIDNMTGLEKFLYLKTKKFIDITSVVLGVLIAGLTLGELTGTALFFTGSLIMMWVLYKIVGKQVAIRADELLIQGGFKTYYQKLINKKSGNKNKK